MELIKKILFPKVHTLMYLLAFVSLWIGLSFLNPSGEWVGKGESVLFEAGVLINRSVWGALLVVSTVSLMWGLIRGNRHAAMFGGMFGFMLWLFASIALVLAGHWFMFITVSMLHTAFHGYVYLTSSLYLYEEVRARPPVVGTQESSEDS